MAQSTSKPGCKILSLIQPKLFPTTNSIHPTSSGNFSKIRRSIHVKPTPGSQRKEDLWFPNNEIVKFDKSQIYKAILVGKRSRFRRLERDKSDCSEKRNKSMHYKDLGHRNPYFERVEKKMKNDFSKESLKKSLDQVNSFMKNHDISSPIGPANIRKSSIVNRSKTKELSSLIPKRSKIKVRSVLERWKNQERLISQDSVSDISPSRIYNGDNSRKGSIRLQKIGSQNSSTIAYQDQADYYRADPSTDLYRDSSSKTYESPSVFDHYQAKNPSSLDKYFKLDLGKKHSNKIFSKNHKREDSLNGNSRIELPKDPSLLEPMFNKSDQVGNTEMEWKKDEIFQKYKAKIVHEKLMKKLRDQAKANEQNGKDNKMRMNQPEPESPTLAKMYKELIEEQKKLEEKDTWEQKRGKRKKNPLIDLTAKLDKVLKEPFKKDLAWIRFNDHYKVANQYQN